MFSFIIFLHSLPASQYTLCSGPQVSLYHKKKNSLVECRASHAPLPSLRHHLQISSLSKPPARVQTYENQMVQGLDYMVGG
jgi:hypothetical protein